MTFRFRGSVWIRARARMAVVVVTVTLTAALALAGCSTANDEDRSITIFAASSLTDVMKQLTDAYTQSHPGQEFKVNFGSSAQLVQQLNAGASTDLLITADQQSISTITNSQSLAPDIAIIASNEIVLAIAPGNPGMISSLSDVAQHRKIALCAASVPCGRAAHRILDAAHLTLSGASEEDNVRAVLTKVSSGQVDAGFVYSTDVQAAQGQGVTELPLKDPSPNKYPLVLTTAGAKKPPVIAFHDWLAGSSGQAILKAAGFGPGRGR
ncbi:MAG TPA: molybdate ABC transporter substrate-binding protein [Micrococcaceae bacterium]|nr:molybdate ABC transporter substrate-binding protein [Micrococcaceae bacterium]